MSLRAYAKLRGVSVTAVSKAVGDGRLVKSVVRDHRGQPKIADAALADREWAAGTDLTKAPVVVKERAAARPSPAPPPSPSGEAPRAARPPSSPPEEPTEGSPDDISLKDELAREKFWKANLAELDFRKRTGDLVEAKDVEAQLADLFGNCRNKLLGVPSRARQQDPALTREQIALIEDLIREALEELAGEAEGEEDAKALAAGAVQ